MTKVRRRPEVNRYMAGDCVQVMKRMRPESVSLICFSPPYDNRREYHGSPAWDYQALGDECYRVLAQGGVAAMVIQDTTSKFAKSLSSFRITLDWCDRAGFQLFECCIYRRNGKPGAWWNTRFRVDHEYIMLFFKGDRPQYFDKTDLMIPAAEAGKVKQHQTMRKDDGTLLRHGCWTVPDQKCRGTVWEMTGAMMSSNSKKRTPEQQSHPATFPEGLVSDIIICFSQPGCVVLDPMCGSGTTCRVADKLGRNWIGIDVSPEYVSLAEHIHQRVRDAGSEG